MSQSTVKKIPNNYFDGMPVTGFHKIVFFIIMMAYFCEQMDNWNFGFIAPALMHTWGLQMSDIGVVTLWYFIGMTAGGFFGGVISDFIGRRKTFLISIATFSFFSVLNGFTDNFHVFVIARSMTGFGVFCLMVCSQAYIAEMAPAESRGKWQNLVAAVGFSAVPVIGVMCRAIIPLAEEAWRFIFYFGGVGLIAFFVGLRYLKESPRWLVARGRLEEAEQVVFEITGKHVDLSEAAKNVQTKVPVMEVLTGMFRRQYIKRTLVLLAIVVFTNPATFTVTNWTATLLKAHGFSLEDSLMATTIISVGVPAGLFFSSFVTDLGGRKIPIMCMLIILAVLGPIFGNMTGYWPVVLTGVVLTAVVMAMGFTIFQALEVGAVLMNMNGRENKVWKGVHGFPNKIFPGGYLMTSRGSRDGRYGVQDGLDLVQIDWDGNVVWKFDRNEYIEDPGIPGRWMARSHHDYQREGSTTGYYAPGMEPKTDSGNTLVLAHRNARNPKISDKQLLDDVILEVDWDGDIVWEWHCNEHFDEMGFREGPKNTLARDPNYRQTQPEGMGDWMHINSMSVLGPNKWYDAGDERFHPDNIIVDGREANIIFIISKATGKIVWKLGPDYDNSPEAKAIGWIIGQHHCHMVPRGLPGEGNILIFDNGGWGGYDVPNPGSPTGVKAALRDHSRVLEIDPVAMKIVWQYTPTEAGFLAPMDCNRFYSPFISGMQRLPNGNTLITEGSDGRVFEVTKDHELVWEFISPYWGQKLPMNMVYRAYRVPYEWVPQLGKQEETPIERIDVNAFRMPGAAALGDRDSEIAIEGCAPYEGDNALCVASVDDPEDQ